jgi:DNA polymerase
MLLSEQPGEQEDLSSKPFVGPAGQILNRALEEARIDRTSVYVTNTVKHFKWELRGNGASTKNPLARYRRLPSWLEAELHVVRPGVLFASARPQRGASAHLFASRASRPAA